MANRLRNVSLYRDELSISLSKVPASILLVPILLALSLLISGCGFEPVYAVRDNGGQANVGANNGPLRGEKQQMYEGGLRIPGCIRVPGRTQPGVTSETTCCTADFFPTISALVGAAVPTEIDGRSLKPVIDLPAASNEVNLWPSREIYFVRREGGPAYSGLTSQALLQGHYKLVHDLPTKQFELFDVRNDPAETKNLAPKLPKKLRELSRRLQFHVQRGGQVPWQPPTNNQKTQQ